MSPSQTKLTLATPALLLAALLAACSNSGTAPVDGPHATVLMRDGSEVGGIVTASSPSGITLMGDDKVSHTFSMAQVKSVSYDQAPPEAASTTLPATSTPTTSSPASSAPVSSAPVYAGADHDDHYHPRISAIKSRTLALPAGALIPVRSEETIDASVATGGQTYAAEVTRDVTDEGGAVVIPRGSNAQIVIRSAARGGRIKGASDLILDLDSVSVEGRRYTLDTEDMIKKGRDGIGKNKRTAEFTGGGAAIGAIIGAIAGGGRGAAIGAASGAGAGAGTQIVTKGSAIRIPAETILTFQLAAPLRVDAAN
ncbi:MAG: hypothetical protein ABI833_10690 [Acidobacteriota bacterium]